MLGTVCCCYLSSVHPPTAWASWMSLALRPFNLQGPVCVPSFLWNLCCLNPRSFLPPLIFPALVWPSLGTMVKCRVPGPTLAPLNLHLSKITRGFLYALSWRSAALPTLTFSTSDSHWESCYSHRRFGDVEGVWGAVTMMGAGWEHCWQWAGTEQLHIRKTWIISLMTL